eukprot:CAMPEP_0176393728 /NCGR_PEP_ID=MMETSP0126-20121128/41973_1 /TAXON_ID=141414 ORGANISM="Strombidinopsis acuminatum, Strain SPMC142" /NCGR_SAMPLE_ID=MMETSP0126 /ASSEMBLY_ACC=CAM_ASM_000229 /LENGTH=60 /DNA_ID=CAMNT_0017765445 /DNA_START=237 /DNA_END=419 /DNA_ORIENTATION=-
MIEFTHMEKKNYDEDVFEVIRVKRITGDEQSLINEIVLSYNLDYSKAEFDLIAKTFATDA